MFCSRMTIASVLAVTALMSGPCIAQTGKPTVTRSWPITSQTKLQSSTTSGTSTVKPVITRDIDNPVRQTVLTNWYSHMVGLSDGGAGCGTGWAIPDGSRIIIEAISVKIVSPSPLNGPYVAIGTSKSPSLGLDESSSAALHIALQPQGLHYQTSTTNAYHYVAVVPVRLQVLKDDWLCDAAYVGPGFVSASAHISYFGYITTP